MGCAWGQEKNRDIVPLAISSSSRRGPDWVTGAGAEGGKMDAWRGRKSLALKIQRTLSLKFRCARTGGEDPESAHLAHTMSQVLPMWVQ